VPRVTSGVFCVTLLFLEFKTFPQKYITTYVGAGLNSRAVYGRLNIGIAGSNTAFGMDMCPRVSVLCCPVSVEALRRADPPAKESYQICLYVHREAQ
jgi:hypothetical protein